MKKIKEKDRNREREGGERNVKSNRNISMQYYVSSAIFTIAEIMHIFSTIIDCYYLSNVNKVNLSS